MRTFKLGFGFNMKAVAMFFRFENQIRTPQLHNCNKSYDRGGEQGSLNMKINQYDIRHGKLSKCKTIKDVPK